MQTGSSMRIYFYKTSSIFPRNIYLAAFRTREFSLPSNSYSQANSKVKLEDKNFVISCKPLRKLFQCLYSLNY